jgi:F0F1-type ATP synthase assembly protein I
VKDNGRLGLTLQLGWTAILALLVPLGLGLWLDKRLATTPLLVLMGGLLGIIVATVGVVRVTTRNLEQLSEPGRTPAGRADRQEDEHSC